MPLWGVTDPMAAMLSLAEPGAKVLETVQEFGGGIKVGAVRDPFGNQLGIIGNPHFSTAKLR